MNILIIKTSSMGDIIHTLPAITDATNSFPDLKIDWVVEEAFYEIPLWHSRVNSVIPIALRRWRNHPVKMLLAGEWQKFYRQLRLQKYDVVIDAQSLIKSALVSRLSRGVRVGLDRKSAREPLASLAYHTKLNVKSQQHAVTRMRQIVSKTLGYFFQEDSVDYGLSHRFPEKTKCNNIVFIHGTSDKKKEWSAENWIILAELVATKGYQAILPWGNINEKQRAEYIARHCRSVKVLAKSNLSELADVLTKAAGVIAVDTGLGHLAAALSVPTVSLYVHTHPDAVGTWGKNQKHLMHDFGTIQPNLVWEELLKVIGFAKKY